MIKKILLVLLLSCSILYSSCQRRPAVETTSMPFRKSYWQIKEGSKYPWRVKMLDSTLYNKELRAMNKSQLLAELGPPDYQVDQYYYYRISQTRILGWPLHTRTLVLLFSRDSLEWIRLHE